MKWLKLAVMDPEGDVALLVFRGPFWHDKVLHLLLSSFHVELPLA